MAGKRMGPELLEMVAERFKALSDRARLSLLQELRAAPLLPGQEAITRPLIPLADGTLLINAPSEPSVGLALQAEVPSADRPS
jgi:hypothetical protein